MFTGIITNIGTIKTLEVNSEKDLFLEISLATNEINRDLEIGCSIAINGVCLTLIKKDISSQETALSFQASKETLEKTTLKNNKIGDLVNMEFAMRIGDEFGGHMVLGHVDGIAKIINIEPVQDSHKFTFSAPSNLMKFIAKKGSVTLDGTSLTVNEVTKDQFSINLIEHTIKNTIFKNSKIGDLVNLEIDTIARYLERFANYEK